MTSLSTNSETSSGRAASGLSPLGRLLLLTLLAAPTAFHVQEIAARGIDPDEFEHLHASWLVSQGDVPYRDFFEHHGPAFYYVTQPLFWMLGPSLKVLWAGRALCLACGLAGAWLISRLARRTLGADEGLIAGCLTLWSVVFHTKALEFRPDVPAFLLLAISASVLWRVDARGRSALLAGALAGLATLFTQKSLVPAAGIWLGWMASAIATRGDASRPEFGRPSLASGTLAFAVGGAIPWGIAFGLFAIRGAADDLWRGAVQQLWVWPIRMSPLEQVRPIVAADFVIWACGLWELLLSVCRPLLARFQRSRGSARGTDASTIPLAVFAAWCLLSLTLVKAAYPQYYLLWTPVLSVLAAKRLVDLGRGPSGLGFTIFAAFAAFGLAIGQVELWQRALAVKGGGALPWLLPSMPQASPAVGWGMLMLFAGVLFASSQGRRGRAVFFLVLLGGFYGAIRNFDAHLWPNDDDVLMVSAVEEFVPPQGRVLDGFSGYAPFRRHAYYHWWLNRYSRALIGDERLKRELLPILEQSPPAAVLYDNEIKRLPSEIRRAIDERYESSDWEPLWLLRKKRK